MDKTPYELYKGRKPNISHLRIFGSKCYVHNNGKVNLGKFDPKADVGMFIGYSLRSKAYRVYNMGTRVVEESMHVVVDETPTWGQSTEDDEILNLPKPPSSSSPPKETPASNPKEEDEPSDEPRVQTVPDEAQLPTARRHHRDHPLDQVLGDVSSGVRT